MAKYQEEVDDNDSICPYCMNRYHVEAQDYSEIKQDTECKKCGKHYWLAQWISIDHHSDPDCQLNGYNHQFGDNGFCAICGQYKQI